MFTQPGYKKLYSLLLGLVLFSIFIVSGFFNKTQAHSTCDYPTTEIFFLNSNAESTGVILGTVVDVPFFSSSYCWTGTIDSDWFKTGNWDSGIVPLTTDDIVIPSAPLNQPQINSIGAVCQDIEIQSGASLTMDNSTAYTLSVSGDWTNDGTFTSGIGTVDFNGTNSLQTVTGASTSDFNILKVTKGAQNRILEVTSLITLNASANPLVLTSGTFKLSSASTIKPFTSSTTINSTSGFWNNGGIITPGGFSWKLSGGLLRNSAGTINIGTHSGNGISYLYNGTIIIEGGELNVAARINGSSTGSSGIYSQSGGIVTVFTVGATSTKIGPFQINANVQFTMSGGTIVIQKASSFLVEYTNLSTNSNVTGGTLQIGNASTGVSQNICINSTTPIWNLTVNSTNSPTAQLVTNGLIVKNDLTIESGAIFIISPGQALTVNGTLTNNSGNTGLIIKSDATLTGSLITDDAVSATVERYMTGGSEWHIIGSPVASQDIWCFIQETSNCVCNKTEGVDMRYAISDYNEGLNQWNDYPICDADVDNFAVGTMAYSVLRSTSGTLSFKGTLNNSNVSNMPIMRTGHGWNPLGNPFPCALNANTNADGTNNLLSINSGQMDPVYTALYLWDPTSGGSYKTINNAGTGTLGQNYVQSGQGFFVRAKDGGGTFSINTNMRVHQGTEPFKSGAKQWPAIRLIAEVENLQSSTIVAFNEDMTEGLDVAYDAGMFKSNPEFALYSRLVEDNGVDFTVQCLPDNQYDKTVIPLGIDAPIGSFVTFSAEQVNIPDDCTFYLEDKNAEVFTILDSPEREYSVNITGENKGVGSFYLHTSSSSLDFNKVDLIVDPFDVKVNSLERSIVIKSTEKVEIDASVYDLSGRLIYSEKLEENPENHLYLPDLKTGIYFIHMRTELGNFSRKLFLE